MNCIQARTIILGKETEKFSQSEIALAESHVSSCEACNRYFVYNSKLQEFLRQKLGYSVTPPTVRESLLQEINSPHVKKSKRFTHFINSWLGRAAAIELLIAASSIGVYLGLFQHRDRASSLLPSLLVQDHIDMQLREYPFDIQTSDKSELERWFEKRVDFAVSIPALRGSKLQGGRLCYLLDRRVAFSVFEREGKLVSAYILNGAGIDLASIDRAEHRDKHRICWRSEKGYNAILWNSDGLIYALVSSIPLDELEALAVNS